MIETDYVHPDEPCWGGYGGPLMREAGLGSEWRWCEVVRVIRGDEKAEYLKDFGPAELYAHIPPHMIPSFGENKVGHVLELLERHRNDTYWVQRAQEQQSTSNLIEEAIRQNEQIHRAIRNRSSFGPAVAVQRNGYTRRRYL